MSATNGPPPWTGRLIAINNKCVVRPVTGVCVCVCVCVCGCKFYLGSMLRPNRQEALLATISEKDAHIALLELSSSKKKKTQDEVAQMKREKDRLVQQLKQQVGRPACLLHLHKKDFTAYCLWGRSQIAWSKALMVSYGLRGSTIRDSYLSLTSHNVLYFHCGSCSMKTMGGFVILANEQSASVCDANN